MSSSSSDFISFSLARVLPIKTLVSTMLLLKKSYSREVFGLGTVSVFLNINCDVSHKLYKENVPTRPLLPRQVHQQVHVKAKLNVFAFLRH